MDPEVLIGKPVVKGTRLPVEFIIGLLAAERSEEDILKSHPRLQHEEIIACLSYKAEVVN